jgi:hypothetical protein
LQDLERLATSQEDVKYLIQMTPEIRTIEQETKNIEDQAFKKATENLSSGKV